MYIQTHFRERARQTSHHRNFLLAHSGQSQFYWTHTLSLLTVDRIYERLVEREGKGHLITDTRCLHTSVAFLPSFSPPRQPPWESRKGDEWAHKNGQKCGYTRYSKCKKREWKETRKVSQIGQWKMTWERDWRPEVLYLLFRSFSSILVNSTRSTSWMKKESLGERERETSRVEMPSCLFLLMSVEVSQNCRVFPICVLWEWSISLLEFWSLWDNHLSPSTFQHLSLWLPDSQRIAFIFSPFSPLFFCLSQHMFWTQGSKMYSCPFNLSGSISFSFLSLRQKKKDRISFHCSFIFCKEVFFVIYNKMPCHILIIITITIMFLYSFILQLFTPSVSPFDSKVLLFQWILVTIDVHKLNAKLSHPSLTSLLFPIILRFHHC